MKKAMLAKKPDYPKMSEEERIDLVEKIYVTYPELTAITDIIKECHRRSKRSSEPKCLSIRGGSGCGKTTIATYYEGLYPRKTTKEGTIVPILSSTVFCPATVKGLVTGLLDSLGDPMADRGTITNQTLRLYHLMEKCRVEMIILDEFQHLIDRDLDKVMAVASDWLKNLLNRTRIPMVLIGLPSSVRILNTNSQLRRRFSITKELKPFGWETPEQQKGFIRFLRATEEALPFPERSHLSKPQMAHRFHCATRGTISNVMKIVRTAAIMAIRQNMPCLTLDLLSLAYEDEIASLYPEHPNPFSGDESGLTSLPPEHTEPLRGARPMRPKKHNEKKPISELLCK